MNVRSADGTLIACERRGTGPALVLVDGALCYRGMGPMAKIAEALADRFSVWTYDRRGRGESGDTAPYAVQREVEDVAAVIQAAGGRAHLFGISSGAALGLHAAAAGLPVDRLALYEVPFALDAGARAERHAYKSALDAALAADDQAGAVRLFMRLVGVPAPVVALMRVLPAGRKLRSVAPTLPHDYAALLDGDDASPVTPQRWAAVTVPTLVLAGGKSPQMLTAPAIALAGVLPDARHHVLPGQTHMVRASVLAPVLAEFLAGAPRGARSPGEVEHLGPGQAGRLDAGDDQLRPAQT